MDDDTVAFSGDPVHRIVQGAIADTGRRIPAVFRGVLGVDVHDLLSGKVDKDDYLSVFADTGVELTGLN